MFHRLRQFIGLRIEASDGEIGKISDIYFDDRSWAVRYLVIETGGWFAGRNVLISPLSVSRIDWDHHTIAILRRCCRLRWLRELLARSDLQGSCAGRKGEEKQS